MTDDEKVSEFIEHLEARPGMYLGEVSFEKLESYLLGYQACCAVNDLDDPFEGLSELIQCRVGRQHPLGWIGGIRHFFAQSEEHGIELVFAAIDDLQRIKEERGLVWLKTEFDRMKSLKRARPMNPQWPSKRQETTNAEQGGGGQAATRSEST